MLYYLVCSVVAYFIARYINARLPNWFTAVWSTLLAVIVGMGTGILMAGAFESFDFAINKNAFFRSILQSFWWCVFAAIAGVSQGRKDAAKKESGSPQTDVASKPPLQQSAEPALPASPAPQHVADDAVTAPPVVPFAPEPPPRPTAKESDTIQTRQMEDALYEKVAAEMAAHQVKEGLWAKAFAQCEGSPERTKALYIKLRVQTLNDEAAHNAQQALPPAVQVENVGQSAAASGDWQDQSKTFLGGHTHPWRRFFARFVDISLLAVLLFFVVFYVAMPEQAAGFGKAVENTDVADVSLRLVKFLKLLADNNIHPIFATVFILYLVWLPAEALFLSKIGTTPAKWLFGIRVAHPDGTLLSFSEALERSCLIFFWGVGFCIPVIGWITQFFACRRLTKTNTTRWDTATSAVVFHKKWGVFRTLVCITCSVAFLAALSWLNTLNRLGELGLYEKIDRENVRQKYEQSHSETRKAPVAQGVPGQRNNLSDGVNSAPEKSSAQLEALVWLAFTGDAQARQALEQVAAQGDADAQYYLGGLYQLGGEGVRQDYAQARHWFEKPLRRGLRGHRLIWVCCITMARVCDRTTHRRDTGLNKPLSREMQRRSAIWG